MADNSETQTKTDGRNKDEKKIEENVTNDEAQAENNDLKDTSNDETIKKGKDAEKGTKNVDNRAEQNKFLREELHRLETSLNEEASKIVKPPVKEHFPYIFNTLEPYYNTYTAKHLLDAPEEVSHAYNSRNTALGLCDPWVDLRMDQDNRTNVESKAINRQDMITAKEAKRKEKSPRGQKEGSIRLAKFPIVSLDTEELATKKLFYSDVPMLRDELHKKYSMNANEKIDKDYEKTKQDFYLMDLDKLERVHPVNRGHLRKSYFAYLQNTPGSKKAVKECVKNMKTAST